MRLVDLLRSLSPVLLAVLVPILISRRRLTRSFEWADATSPESAIHLESAGPTIRWWLSHLTRLGVVRSRPGATHWLDREAWAAYRAARRRRAVSVVIVILLSTILLAVLYRVR